MTKNKNKTIRLFALLGAFLLSAFLVFMPFFVNKNNKNVTYADTVDTTGYTFNSSNLYLPISLYDSNITDPNNTSNYVTSDVRNFRFDITNINGLNIDINCMPVTFGFPASATYFTSSFNSSNFSNFVSCQVGSYYYIVYVYVSGAFIPNISSVRLFSHKWGDTNTSVIELKLIFYDVNSNSATICLYYQGNADTNSSILTDRTYYFGTNLSDNDFYLQGFNDGFNDGSSSGYNTGYGVGYNNGYSVGESAGYNQGLIAGSDVSFLNLIGATVDVPVKAFSGLFDFDVNMGGTSFNLKGFMLALLSVALVIAFIRIIMAK